MKDMQILRQTFIDNVIALVADGGFERVTTRAIAENRRKTDQGQINEAYIYRIFGDKPGLYAAAFEQIDGDMLWILRQKIGNNQPHPEQMCEAFVDLFEYFIENKEKSRFYLRYYYSDYFAGAIKRKHVEAYSAFGDRMLIRAMLSTLLDTLYAVHDGEMEFNEKITADRFRCVCLIKTL